MSKSLTTGPLHLLDLICSLLPFPSSPTARTHTSPPLPPHILGPLGASLFLGLAGSLLRVPDALKKENLFKTRRNGGEKGVVPQAVTHRDSAKKQPAPQMARGPVGGSCSCHMHRWEAGHWVPGLREGWSRDSAVELLMKEMKPFWKGAAGVISQNNGCTVNSTCAHTHTRAHIGTHKNTYSCMCAHVNTHKHTHIHTCMQKHSSQSDWLGSGAELALEQERTSLGLHSFPFSQKVCPGKTPLPWCCL